MAKHKRMNGEGSFVVDEARNIVIYQFYYTDINGKRCRGKKAAKSKGKAKAKAEAFLDDLERQRQALSNRGKTVQAWVSRWLSDYIRPNVRPKTYETYHSCLINHIVPYFGNILLSDLEASKLQEHFAWLQQHGGIKGQGISPTSVRTVRRYFSMCLDEAIRVGGLLDTNPVKQTKPPKAEKIEIVTLSQDEIKVLIENAGKLDHSFLRNMLPVLIRLALATGMRQGELFGLQWSDVDTENCCINLKRTLTYPKGKGAVLQEPKTATGRRKIPISKSDMEILKGYRKWQQEYAASLGDLFTVSDYVFTSTFGEPLRFSNFLRRHWRPLLNRCGISKKFVFHGLRHTHATMLLRAGVHPRVVMERLGHSSIKITLDTYSHVLPDMQEKAVEAIGAVLDS